MMCAVGFGGFGADVEDRGNFLARFARREVGRFRARGCEPLSHRDIGIFDRGFACIATQ